MSWGFRALEIKVINPGNESNKGDRVKSRSKQKLKNNHNEQQQQQNKHPCNFF